MSDSLSGAASSAAVKLIRDRVERLDLEKGLKSLVLYVVDNSSTLLDFGIEYARQKASGRVDPSELMTSFLKSKGKSLSDFGISIIDNETLSNAGALLSLVLDVQSSAKYSSIPVFGIALTIGFLINDAASFLVNFTPAQRAYYELFLRQSGGKTRFVAPRIVGPKY